MWLPLVMPFELQNHLLHVVHCATHSGLWMPQ